MMNRTVVLDVVGLTRSLLTRYPTKHLKGLMEQGSVDVSAAFPAVTCTAQANYTTGRLPRDHGIVANGWLFRELAQVWLWRQSERLIQGDLIQEVGRRLDRGFTMAKVFWWFSLPSSADWYVTPKPVYTADGRKLPDCYSSPPYLRKELTRLHGPFPLFRFWGPATDITSSRWIAEAAKLVEENHRPILSLVYIPHLDYVLQREGPEGRVAGDLAEVDALVGELLGFYQDRGVRVIVLSEYGITQVTSAVHPNRILRDAGLLEVKVDLGREYLDVARSRAFAVADHQVAHVYVAKDLDVPKVVELFSGQPGVDMVLDQAGKREMGLDHPRSGEVVLVARPDSWFTYYWWTDDSVAPDYARTVDIHSKPGYDPCELFIDPAIPAPKLKLGWKLLLKKLGFRTLMDVTPLDPSLVKGSHGRVTDDPADGPIFMTTEPGLLSGDRLDSTDVMDAILAHVFPARPQGKA